MEPGAQAQVGKVKEVEAGMDFLVTQDISVRVVHLHLGD
jgi:hypothetical protein